MNNTRLGVAFIDTANVPGAARSYFRASVLALSPIDFVMVVIGVASAAAASIDVGGGAFFSFFLFFSAHVAHAVAGGGEAAAASAGFNDVRMSPLALPSVLIPSLIDFRLDDIGVESVESACKS